MHIAQFLPPDVLRNLFSVNRAFFEWAMDARYREVEFAENEPWKFIGMVYRLRYVTFLYYSFVSCG